MVFYLCSNFEVLTMSNLVFPCGKIEPSLKICTCSHFRSNEVTKLVKLVPTCKIDKLGVIYFSLRLSKLTRSYKKIHSTQSSSASYHRLSKQPRLTLCPKLETSDPSS